MVTVNQMRMPRMSLLVMPKNSPGPPPFAQRARRLFVERVVFFGFYGDDIANSRSGGCENSQQKMSNRNPIFIMTLLKEMLASIIDPML